MKIILSGAYSPGLIEVVLFVAMFFLPLALIRGL